MTDKEAQKKQIGELLKAADKSIKNAQWTKALEDVNKALTIEPNNMYAMAYKDRINVSITEEKKKAEEEKVKKLTEEKKAADKAADQVKETPPETTKPDEKLKKDPPPAEQEPPAKEESNSKGKDESAARIEALRQEFSATQAKLQREVAQLTMQVKEAQAVKDAMEKKLKAQISELEKNLEAAQREAKKTDSKDVDVLKKEIETIKAKHQKDLERAKEVAAAESLAQIATLQKEVESLKESSDNSSIQKQGEEILRTLFTEAWRGGMLTDDKRNILVSFKSALKISDDAFADLEKTTKIDAYINALKEVWRDGAIGTEESDYLQTLREKLGIPAEDHFKLETKVRKELKK